MQDIPFVRSRGADIPHEKREKKTMYHKERNPVYGGSAGILSGMYHRRHGAEAFGRLYAGEPGGHRVYGDDAGQL